MGKITVDRASLHAAFPASIPVPPLLLAFADWVENVPYGSTGYFEVLRGERLDQAFPAPPPTARMVARLGIFLGLPDGSRIALWDHGAAAPSVVLLGSEGELRTVAPNLRAFLAALSRGQTGIHELDDDEAASHRNELAAWLARSPGGDEEAAPSPSFNAWYRAALGGGEPAPSAPVAAAGPFHMQGFTGAVERLCGRPATDPEVKSLIAALDLRLGELEAGEGTLYVDDRNRGFCFSLSPDRSTGALRLEGCHLYSEGHESHRGFSHALPLGITWDDTSTSLVRLGPPSTEIVNKKTGQLSSQRWWLDEPAKKYVSVGYAGGGARIRVIFMGILPQVP
jgi:hypothetical protein